MPPVSSILRQLSDRRDLSERDAQAAIGSIMRGESSESEMASLFTAWKDKGVTVDELVGAARAMRALATALRVPPGILVDTCGTGGDGLGTFNISTIAAFAAAAAGARVAKHGNRGATSACGSADLLTALGVTVDVEPEVVSRCLEEVGIGFLYAPRFHTAMRHVAPVRRQLGFRTIFNLLGPLTNPAGAACQIVGVSDEQLVATMAEALRRLGARHALVVRGDDGLDEVSTTAPTRLVELVKGQLVSYSTAPEALGVSRVSLDQLRGGDPVQNARIALDVLEGRPGAHRDAVLVNAGCALYVGEAAGDITSGIELARRALDNGRARQKLEQLKAMTTAR